MLAAWLIPDTAERHGALAVELDEYDRAVDPELRRTIEACVPTDGHIFDFGAGDGQTFALVAASVPQGTRVSIGRA